METTTCYLRFENAHTFVLHRRRGDPHKNYIGLSPEETDRQLSQNFLRTDNTILEQNAFDVGRLQPHFLKLDIDGDSPSSGSTKTARDVLDRTFEAPAPNRKWIAEFTYVWTAEGWLYVAVVIDLFSRRVVGWSMSAAMTAQLVTDALVMAIWRRGKPDALLHHSDRGSQSGLKWSSQHPDEGGCDENSKAAFGSVWAGAIVVARSTLRGRTR